MSSSTTFSSSSASRSQYIFNHALEGYTKQTGVDLTKYDFANQIERCSSPDEVLIVIRDKAKKFQEYRDGNRNLINWITPVVHFVHGFAGFLGEATSIVPSSSPGKAIYAGIDILLTAAMDVSSSYDALVDLFECVGNFVERLNIYTDMPLTDGMTDILVRIMAELLSVLALATKQIKQGRLKKYAKTFFKKGGDIEAVLLRLDRLTTEEARMTVKQTLDVVYGLANNVKSVMDNNNVSTDGNVSTDSIQQALVTMQGTESQVNKIRRDRLQDTVRNWLSSPDPSTNQNTMYEKFQLGTAEWFFQGDIFEEWKAIGPILWIHGKPGSGKSTLISSIIQDLDAERAAGLASVVYYYFDFRDANKQTRHGLLSSLLLQLASESDSCYEVLSRLYTAHSRGARRPTDIALMNCLEDMLEQHRQATYMIIDAIDECPNTSGFPTPRAKVLEFLEGLFDFQLPYLRICIASRPEVDIRNTLERLTSLQVSLHEESGQRRDILDYVTKVVRTDKQMCKWNEEDKLFVIRIIAEKSEGMFLWACCQLDSLRHCFPTSIRSTIYSLPNGLDETYEKTLVNINPERQESAQRLFQCLTVSFRPLRVDELAEVLAIRFNSDPLSNYSSGWRSWDATEAVLLACSSLITVVNVGGSRVVQFAHFSVKEFLTSERLATMRSEVSRHHILPGPAHTVMAKACLSILVRLDENVDKKAIKESPFALYAARHWIEHAQFDDVSSHIQDGMIRLFDSDKPHFRAWIWLYDIDRHWRKHMSTPHPTQPQASPLYYAALCGFYGLVEHLVRTRPSEINARGGYHTTPLHASLRRGHRKITPLLLREGADVDVRDNENATPLHRACRAGNLDVVQLLLTHNADIHAQTGKQELPLHFAAGEGEAKTCRLLMERGADVNRKDNQGWGPLHSAARYGHLEVVRMLLDRGVNVNTKKEDDWTPLHLASANGKFEVVYMLIRYRADIDIRNKNQDTPLVRAAANGCLKVTQLLLNSGANVNVINKQSWTPLHTAARNGYPEVVQLFVGFGADINAQTETGKTPLAMACGNGKIAVARILIQCGSNLNTADKDGWAPLHSAVRYGHLDVTRLLLDSGAHVNAYKGDRWTPIHLAASNGHLDIVKLLIQRGANIDSRNDKKETPLDRAVMNGFLDMSRFLVECGADVFSQDNRGWTPFHTASKCGHIHVAKFLLDRGVPVNVRNGNEGTALYLASNGGKLDIVLFLIENGADIQAKDGNGWNPVHIASQNGHVDVVQLLIRAGVPVDLRNGAQKTPLALASSKGKVEVARFLVERGADLYARDDQNWMPLHFASRHGHTEVARLLLSSGVNVDAQKGDLWSPLHLTAANGHVKLSRLLIEGGATIDIVNDREETPLHRAAGNGKADVAGLLIDHGANVNVTDNSGWTPLHAASYGGHQDVVRLLLRRGANVEALNETNQDAEDVASENKKSEVARFLAEYKSNPDVQKQVRSTTLNSAQTQIMAEEEGNEEKKTLHTAAKEGKVDLVMFLLDKGENVNSENTYNKTPLDVAATKGNLDVVRLLIKRGARVDSRDKFGWTPLHKAARYGHLQVSQELINHGADVNARKQDNWTPIHLSARNGHLGLVKLLLERDADVRVENDEGRTPYQLSIGNGYQKIVDLLRDYERGEHDA